MLVRNPLEIPCGVAPGYNYGHVGSKGIVRFSGMAMGANFVNILTGNPGALTGVPTAAFDGSAGLLTKFGGSTASSFAGCSAVNDTSITMAGIVKNADGADLYSVVASSGTNAGWYLNFSSNVLGIRAGGTALISSVIATTSFPPGATLFVAASANASASNFLAMDIGTGSMLTDVQGGAASNAPDGTYIVGNRFNLDKGYTFGVARAMANNAFSSMHELVAFAYKPWSFWHPEA